MVYNFGTITQFSIKGRSSEFILIFDVSDWEVLYDM